MKGFQKLALATAIAALPFSASAMEPLNDSELSGVTGQDGISLGLDINVTTEVWYEDTTGHDAYTHGGFITIPALNITANNLTVDIDVASADDGAGEHLGADSGALVISIDAADPINISGLDIGVQGSDTAAGTAEAADDTRLGDVADSTTIVSIANLEIQPDELIMTLGPQGEDGNFAASGNDLMSLTGNTGQITLDDVKIFGGANPGDGFIGVEELIVEDVNLGDTDPTTVNLDADGLVLVTSDDMVGINVTMSRVSVGDDTQPALGNIYLRDLDLSGNTITVSGKN